MGERYYPEAVKFNTLSNEYFCIDFETTSLDPKGEGIIEIYFKVMENGEIKDEAHKLFWHKNFYKTKKIHQIPFRSLVFKESFNHASKYIKQDSIVDKMKQYIERCKDPNDSISFMAHYSPFEIKWIEDKLGLNIGEDPNFKIFDTRSAERFLHPEVESASLIPTCARRGIESPNGVDFHRAKWDVDAMYLVAQQQIQQLEDKGYKTGDKWRVLE